LLESVILVAGVAVVIDLWPGPRGRRDEWRDNVQQLSAVLHQALRQKYPPGDTQAYEALFPEEFMPGPMGLRAAAETAYDRTTGLLGAGPMIDLDVPVRWSAPVEMARLAGGPKGMPAVPEAPEIFFAKLAEAEVLAASLENTLETGPFVPRRSTSLGISFVAVQDAARSLRLLAGREWLKGNHQRALEYAADIIRLGDALEPHYADIGQLIRVAVYTIGLGGFDSFAWADPGAEEDRLILTRLTELETEKRVLPPHAESPLWSLLMIWGNYRTDEEFGDLWAATMLLGSAGESAPDEATRTLLKELGIIPDEKLDSGELVERLSRWTTLPAMRRRAGNIPEAYYHTDPWLPASAALRLPPLVYLASRVRPGAEDTEGVVSMWFAYGELAEGWFERTGARAETLRAAYQARVWRDENGRWPGPEEFRTLAGPQASVQWHVLTDPGVLVDRFRQRYQTLGGTAPAGEWEADATGPAKIRYPLHSNPAAALPRLAARALVPTQDEIATWMKGILEAQPLVESGTASRVEAEPSGLHTESGPVLIANLRLPKSSFWVTHPGVDGKADGPTVVYDASNGTTSAGDIVQLAGWEW